MRILILTHEFPPFHGGIATYASNLARAATACGHDITVYAPDFGHDLQESDARDFPFQIIRYHAESYSYTKLPQLLWRSWRFIKPEQYDLIHAVDVSYVLSLAFLNRLREIPFSATSYGTEILSMPNSRQARWLALENMFEYPDKLFAISQFTQRLVLERCTNVNPQQVTVTPLGVDPFWFTPPDKSSRVLEQFGVPSDHKVILTVSRLDERKGHKLVLQALQQLAPSLRKSVSYLIVGDGSDETYKAELQSLASQSDVHVTFTGEVTQQQLHDIYANSHVLCMPGQPHPKKVEGFGLVYLEAAAQGVPSIATRHGGVPEVVIDGQTGTLIEPEDTEALTTSLTELLTDDNRRRQLGIQARQHAQTFTWQRCAELTYGK